MFLDQDVRQYYVYIMTGISRTLYVGVTSNLERRVYEHKGSLAPGFTAHYRLNRLVYYETSSDILSAIAREKQVKAWRRSKKMALIRTMNPDWWDLSEDWSKGEDQIPHPPVAASE